ncbi:hypothetical protein [Bradyrhizobium sp. LA7.1]|uniref:hypothetical protein n=1 Tax=Bradyrhizobium sp. LA7.1 TaxID=3156324 RepID=UPI003395A849
MLPADAAFEYLPSPSAPWREVERFCALIGGSGGDPREINQLCEIAREVEADLRAASIDDLLVAIYFNWRRARWNAGEDAEVICAIRGAISELGRRR